MLYSEPTRVCPETCRIFGAHNWTKQFAKAAAKAEMAKGFAPYDLRHGRAAHLLSTTGDDILGVGYALGHKRPTRPIATSERTNGQGSACSQR